jgi:hypothetical protein
MLNPVLLLLARDRYVSDGCEEAMAQGLAESYARRYGYCGRELIVKTPDGLTAPLIWSEPIATERGVIRYFGGAQ